VSGPGRKSTPECIAHRGAHAALPENSLPAFVRALELAADAIELDVHATRDGEVVVHHDAFVNAGRMPTGPKRAIVDLSLSELRGFPLAADIRIPSLQEVLEVVGTAATIYIEIKAVNIEPLVVRCIRESNALCAVHSFDHRIVRAVKQLFPAIRTGVLEVARHLDPWASLAATGADDLWQEAGFIDEDLVASVHDRGGKVIAWTSNDPAQWKTLKEFGVDGICTDRAGELAAFGW
jgi:glycerophosphoryl diester phosphodiesterase